MMQNKNFPKIALTGGYASGKSTVAKYFLKKGYLTFSADEIYANLIKNEDFAKQIYEILDLDTNNFIAFDRKLVSNAIFNDAKKLELINNFTHKAVYDEIDKIYLANCNKKLIFEIPLLFESKRENDFDIVIVVLRKTEDRIKYGAKRDNISESQSILRIKNQVNYDNISAKGHTFIYNDSSLSNLEAEVNKVIAEIESRYS